METGEIILIVLFILVFIGLILIVGLFLWRFFNPTQLTPDPSNTSLAASLHHSAYSLDQKTLVLYSYCESSQFRKSNLEFFIQNGFYRDHPLIDYVFIINGRSSATLPIDAKNAKFIYRENKGRDFKAWGQALTDLDISSYQYFVFLNDSVRGPMIPNYLHNILWIESFTSRINNFTKVVGCTVNTEGSPHVQTYCWATDKIMLDLLIKASIFDPKDTSDVMEYVRATEQMVSNTAFRAGYNIDCFMPHYHHWNWNEIFVKGEEGAKYKDPKGNSLPTQNPTSFAQHHPFEIMFVKYKSAPNFVFQFYY